MLNSGELTIVYDDFGDVFAMSVIDKVNNEVINQFTNDEAKEIIKKITTIKE